ncbi:phosphatase PAP2 family protein [uncultured Pseudodesulfovibrio sp.]|uniref:phosphatase PAP2 family protein n=1 Tax=uncultured Pseudodesulfovibrio sp. TaxID=2035858 RepID=UPI0029C7C2BF|nr:phosphatase PAP2 family protein [uncultured Pseudodesulfovibrio sp.]
MTRIQEAEARSSLYRELLNGFRVHIPFIAYILCYMALLIMVAYLQGRTEVIRFNMYDVLPIGSLIFILAYFLGRTLNIVIVERPAGMGRYIANDIRQHIRERLPIALPVMVFLPLFMSTFTAFKVLIPVNNPYSWDATFAALDAFIHGGVQPWQLTHALINGPQATFYVNFAYNAWFFTMFTVINWMAFSIEKPRLRMQFLLAFIMTWSLLGSGLGTLLSSVGPCYLERLTGADTYAPLMAHLHQLSEVRPIWALGTQDMLWNSFSSKEIILGSGISAMPSMHVASALLFALVGCRSNWVFGTILSVFFLCILVGSVHLGWHYAVDGYVSIVLTLVIWWAVGRMVGRLLPEDPAPA